MSAPIRKKPTNLSIDHSLLAEARSLNVNLSRAAEDGIRAAVARTQRERWQDENRSALQSSNDFVDRAGLPLDAFRPF